MTRTDTPSWLPALREAIAGKPRPGVERAHGVAPSVFAADAANVLTSALLAALIVAAARFRAQVSVAQFDLIALLLRVASVAFALRTLIALGRLLARLRRDRHAAQQALAWSEAGLLYQSAGGERWAARADVLALVVPEHKRRGEAALAPLYVVLRGAPRPEYWELPPYFASSAEILQARLERWLGARPPGATPAPPRSDPERRYAGAAQGQPEPGDLVVPEGRGYRLRAPYGVLLALVFVVDALRVAGPYRARLLPAAAAALLLALAALAGWFAWMRRRRAARLGIALVFTPEELVLRGRHGALSLPWSQLARAEVVTRLGWSPFVGAFAERVLWLRALDGTEVPFDGAFLGVPAEVAAALAEAYREGRALGSAADVPASHGSGAGGGSSATLGTTSTDTSATRPSADSATRGGDDAERSNES